MTKLVESCTKPKGPRIKLWEPRPDGFPTWPIQHHVWRGGDRCLRCGAIRRRGFRCSDGTIYAPRSWRIKVPWEVKENRLDADGFMYYSHCEAGCRGKGKVPKNQPLMAQAGRQTTVNFSFSADVIRRLRGVARREGRSLSNLLGVLLEGAIQRVDFRVPGDEWARKWLKQIR